MPWNPFSLEAFFRSWEGRKVKSSTNQKCDTPENLGER
jgi:hypothetical protein